MAGTKEGALKARETNIEKYGKDFYKKIGKKSWKNPDRDRKTGFALRSPEERKALGKKGGKTNKGKKYEKLGSAATRKVTLPSLPVRLPKTDVPVQVQVEEEPKN